MNAAYWISEFHIDGLRLDAIQAIVDDSQDHIIAAIVRSAREAGAGRDVLVIAENELQDSRMLRSVEDGGLWARRGVERRLPSCRARGDDRA